MRESGPRVLIVGGEASGDLYGGLLMHAMSALAPDLRFSGVGGPSMRSAGLEALGDAEAMGVTGLLEVVGRLRVIWRAFRAAKGVLADPEHRPDLAILIDYPDFNLRLAAHARRAGVPVLYFISPQVWAWRRWRVRRIARLVERMLVILPFEEAIYREAGVPVEFVGHPLVDLARPSRSRRQVHPLLGLDPDRRTVALLPGSRGNELRALLPPMLSAARRLRDEFHDLQFLLPLAPTLDGESVEQLLERSWRHRTPPPVPVRDNRYDALAACDAAVVASGTATLEAALLAVPMVIVYRMNPVTFAIARSVSDLRDIGMANLIAGRRVVPELLQKECNGNAIAGELRAILTDPPRAETMRRELAQVRAKLGPPGAIARAARSAWSMISARRAK